METIEFNLEKRRNLKKPSLKSSLLISKDQRLFLTARVMEYSRVLDYAEH